MTDCFTPNFILHKDLTILPIESVDYWLVMRNGDIFDDGHDGEIRFEDGRETIYTESQGKQGSLEEFLGIESGYGYHSLLKAAGFRWNADSSEWSEDGFTINASAIEDLRSRGMIETNPAASIATRGFGLGNLSFDLQNIGGSMAGLGTAISQTAGELLDAGKEHIISTAKAGVGIFHTVKNGIYNMWAQRNIDARIRNSVSVFDGAAGASFWDTVMNSDVAEQYAVNENQGPQCNTFLADTIRTQFGDAMYEDIFPNGIIPSANDIYDQFENNRNLSRLDTDEYSISQIQAIADGGVLVIVAYSNPDPKESGHVALVANSGLSRFSVPEVYTRGDGSTFPIPQSGTGGQLDPGRYWPMVAQAGTVTGVVTMPYATNGWNDHLRPKPQYQVPDNYEGTYRDYLLENHIRFYSVNRRR